MFWTILIAILAFYLVVCFGVYWIQEKLIFHPDKLPKDFDFQFNGDFEELYLEMKDGVILHALHFKAKNPKGIVFYVHGNAGSLNDWGGLSDFYLNLDYDLFMFDYRGFGKSDGKISSEKQFFDDVQALYDYVKNLYAESQIIVEGFSIGTATAAKIALENKPRQLVLKAPYYTLSHLVKTRHFYLPMSLLKYKFKTVDFLQKLDIPTTVFHGTMDELIPYENAVLLQKKVTKIDFVPVPDCLHNDIPFTEVYREKMKALLDNG